MKKKVKLLKEDDIEAKEDEESEKVQSDIEKYDI